MKKFTEGEVTSLVRRFFRLQGFSFLSALPSGEKLYYTLNNQELNKKQPDSVFLKNDLVIICEDKVTYNELFKDQGEKVSDYEKLTTFLSSDPDKERFIKKISQKTGVEQIRVGGCLSSIGPKQDRDSIISEEILNIQIETTDFILFTIIILLHTSLEKYFPEKEVIIKL